MPQNLLTQDLNEIFRKHIATVIIGLCIVVGVVVGTAVTWYWMTSIDLATQAQANEERSRNTARSFDGHVAESLEVQRETRATLNQMNDRIGEMNSNIAVLLDRSGE